MLRSSPSTATSVTDVTDPTLAVYRPENPNGASMVVAPGGGYTRLSYENEGTKVCQWLNSIGVTAGLLKYRTPTRDEKLPFEMPVQDAQRAIGIIRHHAGEWGLDPNRVGLLGFSAGANLAGHVAWDRGERTYPQDPQLDDAKGPDFIVFIYGGGFVETKGTIALRSGFTMPSDAPPAFFLVAGDDHTNPIEAAMLYVEYKKLNIPAELHICTKGGHGFGMRKAGNPVNHWPELCAEWMQSMGYLKAK
jgi:acetyl esterase/lipase